MRAQLRRLVAGSLTMLALTLSWTPSLMAQESDDWAVGSWAGTLEAGPQVLQIIYHVTRGDDGTLTGTMDVPAQGATGIPLTTVAVDGQTLTMTFPVPGGGTYEGTLGDSGGISGTFTQGPASFPMELARSEGAAEPPPRPQAPEPPYPYDVDDVTFPNPDAGIELAGTITTPPGDGPFPGVVLVSGSGPQDRDEALAGHKPFHVLADHLTRNGIAVLRYDDRGVGESGGDFSSADSEDLTSDALSGLAFLAARSEVSADRVGIVGHSEGGIIGPMAASRSADVRFVVMLAGPGVPGIEVLVEQGQLIGRAAGTPDAMLEMNEGVQRGLADIVTAESDPEVAAEQMRDFMRGVVASTPAEFEEVVAQAMTDEAIEQAVSQMNSPWFRYFLHYDPRTALGQVSVPVLALFGGKDLQVPPEQSAAEVEAALERARNRDATIRVLPGLNHLFQEAGSGSPAEYQQIEETMNPVALGAVTDWILQRFSVPIS